MQYRLTVYHDQGKGVTTYPEAYTLDQLRAKVALMFREGCEMPDPKNHENVLFYPPFRVWKVVAEPLP